MAVRWRNKGLGKIVCAAENEAEKDDVYFDDWQHQILVEKGVLKTNDDGETWYFNKP